MDILLGFVIVFSVVTFVSVMIPFLMVEEPWLMSIAALLPLGLLQLVVGLHWFTLFLCFLFVCLPFLLYKPDREK